MGTGFFPGVKCGRGVLLTPHSLLVPWSSQERVEVYLYFPYGPHGLYRALLPVQGYTFYYFKYQANSLAVKQKLSNCMPNRHRSEAEVHIKPGARRGEGGVQRHAPTALPTGDI